MARQHNSAIHVGSRWKIQDKRQINNTDNTETKHNPEKANNAKTQLNKTTLAQTPLTTLGLETRWAYSTMLEPRRGQIYTQKGAKQRKYLMQKQKTTEQQTDQTVLLTSVFQDGGSEIEVGYCRVLV